MLEDLKCKNTKITIENSYHSLGFGEKIEDLKLSESSITKGGLMNLGLQFLRRGNTQPCGDLKNSEELEIFSSFPLTLSLISPTFFISFLVILINQENILEKLMPI